MGIFIRAVIHSNTSFFLTPVIDRIRGVAMDAAPRATISSFSFSFGKNWLHSRLGPSLGVGASIREIPDPPQVVNLGQS